MLMLALMKNCEQQRQEMLLDQVTGTVSMNVMQEHI